MARDMHTPERGGPMFLLTLTACIFGSECGLFADCAVPVPLDCAAVAITTGAGDPDPCDVSACNACVESCGADCAVQESFPPTYTCGDGGSWDVTTQCPAWEPPGSIAATNIEDLGCGDPTEVITAEAAEAGTIAVVHGAYAEGCCPVDVAVHVSAGDHVIDVAYTPVDDFCECICPLAVGYDLVGVNAGEWTLNAGGVSAAVTVP
jgi:hypothetical protein